MKTDAEIDVNVNIRNPDRSIQMTKFKVADASRLFAQLAALRDGGSHFFEVHVDEALIDLMHRGLEDARDRYTRREIDAVFGVLHGLYKLEVEDHASGALDFEIIRAKRAMNYLSGNETPDPVAVAIKIDDEPDLTKDAFDLWCAWLFANEHDKALQEQERAWFARRRP